MPESFVLNGGPSPRPRRGLSLAEAIEVVRKSPLSEADKAGLIARLRNAPSGSYRIMVGNLL